MIKPRKQPTHDSNHSHEVNFQYIIVSPAIEFDSFIFFYGLDSRV